MTFERSVRTWAQQQLDLSSHFWSSIHSFLRVSNEYFMIPLMHDYSFTPNAELMIQL